MIEIISGISKSLGFLVIATMVLAKAFTAPICTTSEDRRVMVLRILEGKDL
ncbi:hypothetical protein ADU37_CDS14240 [Thermococcus sp. 2319x1]|nr:hypothetical protein ADU37_CDS14240 [Thermococcus sp. 2319x1]